MKILGIGNAIVDVICKVEDGFITKNKLTKSTMKLIFDESEFKKLLSELTIEKTVSGGSDDNLGVKYEEGLTKEKVKYLYKKKKEILPTGTCLILITPDSERTMITYLGTAGKINEKDIDGDIVKKAEITLLEGYLWDEGEPKKAFDKAIQNSNISAMSLSDLFCVDRHRDNFLDLVKNKLDIVFANEQEIMSLINAQKFDEVISFAKTLNKVIIVTRGANGSMGIRNDKVFEFPA